MAAPRSLHIASGAPVCEFRFSKTNFNMSFSFCDRLDINILNINIMTKCITPRRAGLAWLRGGETVDVATTVISSQTQFY
jgi:hypothetical protein